MQIYEVRMSHGHSSHSVSYGVVYHSISSSNHRPAVVPTALAAVILRANYPDLTKL